MQPKELWELAKAAAIHAAQANEATLPPERERGCDCGFAWVVIKPARGAFVKFCKAEGFGQTRNYEGGGFQIWYSKFDPTLTQSVSTHFAAAQAFAKVLVDNGIKAYADQRLD